MAFVESLFRGQVMTEAVDSTTLQGAPGFPQRLGHPKPLWMLFMTEFWERFAFYSVSWALALYIVQQFYHGDPAGQAWASGIFGAYTALIYGTCIFGGWVADRVIGYQRTILLGALVMATGLFVLMLPSRAMLLLGLALVIVGDGLFKPNISTMVGQLYGRDDPRRDRGFTLFYMGINAGALLAPLLTGWMAAHFTSTPMQQNFRLVFGAAGVGMLLSLVWFWFGRRQLKQVGRPAPGTEGLSRVAWVLLGVIVSVPLVYLLLSRLGADGLQWLLGLLFVAVAAMLLVEAGRHDRVQVHRVIAMLIIFAINMFAPIVTLVWAWLDRRRMEPSIPRKFGFGLLFNSLGFLVLMIALAKLLGANGLIPFWPLVLCYVMQTLGELCLSPIGLSMVTKLATSVLFAGGAATRTSPCALLRLACYRKA